MRNVVLEIRNIVKFYGYVTLRVNLQNEIMTYVPFSELKSLQSQYHLFYLEPKNILYFFENNAIFH